MIRLGIFLLFVLTGQAIAEPAKVTSGEHDGFTRLVFDFGRPVTWTVGRSDDGYSLHVEDKNISYDLNSAFTLIGRSRLAGLSTSPDGGDVQITLACPCHAMPFEFRPGIVVIDLKDGAPPKGSSFEEPLADFASTREEKSAMAPDQTAPDAGKTFDWLSDARTATETSIDAPPVPVQGDSNTQLLPPDPGLQPLRDTLISQLAQGASQGVVEMADVPADTTLPDTAYPSAQIRIGNAPTSVNEADTSMIGDIGSEGAACVDADALDLAAWGDETLPATSQIADLRIALSGEFDKVNEDSLQKSIKLYLYFGFGAEARQMVRAFDSSDPETKLFESLGYLIDGEMDPTNTFAGQTACDGPAALWAMLADSSLSKGDPINEGAVRLAFSALPMHLRKSLGPVLSDRFLALDNASAARALTGSLARANTAQDATIALMEANLDLHTGDSAEAEALADQVLLDPGQERPEALVALVAARINQKLPVSPQVVASLEAYLADYEETPEKERLAEALMLARAASGEFEKAFGDLPKYSMQTDTLWDLAVNLAPDDTFLELAVLSADSDAPAVREETAASVARRLSSLGLATASSPWLRRVEGPDPLLVAEIALRSRDARAALQPIADHGDDLATAIKVRAYDMLGEFGLQAQAMKTSGDGVAVAAALAKAGDWTALSEMEGSAWQNLATEIASPVESPALEDSDAGTLARGHALIEAGSNTQAAVQALLNEIPSPTPVSQ